MKKPTAGILIFLLISFLVWRSDGAISSNKIEWQSYSAGMARGKFEKKKIFLHFYADWCASCKVMDKNTFNDSGVIASLNEKFIPIKVDVDKEKETSAVYSIRAIPDTWFIAENGDPIGHRAGYIPPDELKVILKMILDEATGQ
ncbi:MAG: DUF255 domain-containing protein [Desulfobacterales bacterium]|jgi:hypothetical protein